MTSDEKLQMQGMPMDRLKFGNETEAQKSDLAGNAMSMPVVAAAQLAVIVGRQLQTQMKESAELTKALETVSKMKHSNAAQRKKQEAAEEEVMNREGALREFSAEKGKGVAVGAGKETAGGKQRARVDGCSMDTEEAVRAGNDKLHDSLHLLADLGHEAFLCSTLCTCESSGKASAARSFLRCSVCAVCVCKEHTWCYALE